MPFAGTFDPILPGECKTYSIDFVNDIGAGDSLQSATATLDVFYGSDPNAASLISGHPAISGTTAVQMVGGGASAQPGVIYRWTVTAITEGDSTLIGYAHLPCAAVA
jgi:hypothetical protein